MKNKVLSVLILAVPVLAGSFRLMPDTEKETAKAKTEVVEARPGVTPDELPGFVNARAFRAPTELSFAGEQVPLDDPDVWERLDRELYVNSYFHSSTIFLIKRASRWFPLVNPILKEEGIPEDMAYLPLIESGFTNAVSPAGAAGHWQLMRTTAREYGLEVNEEVDERYHPVKATQAAVKFLKKSHAKFGNWTNVAASYNIGMSGLQRRLKKQRVESYYDLLLNEETKRYVFRLLAIREILNNQNKYGFIIPADQLYYPEKVKKVEVKKSITDLTAFAFKHGINYKILKRHNPWLRRNTLTIKKSGKIYEIWIPEKS
ncbi:murein transglycosylase [Fulvitalea axinellae]|uniref:Murein transglycosylase n=1 Tax=Fulvitalea axinellae TaxID=1182444 RepID=A0AAU9CG12_9BACT|nr:murein transglycosylase [Fulvitalea axinellae]